MYMGGSMVEERDGCLEGTPNWRRSAIWLGVFVEGQDFCFEGTRNWRESAIPLGVFVSLWVE